MISARSLEQIVENVEAYKQQGVMDPKAAEEFTRYVQRYNANLRAMKDLKIDTISPVKEGAGPKTPPPPAQDFGVDQPFIEAAAAREMAEALASGEAAAQGAAAAGTATGRSNSETDAQAAWAREALSPVSGGGGPALAAQIASLASESSSPREDAQQGTPQTVHCTHYGSIPRCPDDMNLTHELLNKLVILRLNGGLGTSMGCKGPKSAVEVRNSLSFLDMAVRQVEFLNTKHGVDVPLVLMNSFNTDEETKRVLSRYAERHVSIRTFRQSCFPRLDKSTLEPMPTEKMSAETQGLWYPPGHGDVYTALARCGLLQQLVSMGKEYVFISNIDNLGATVDLSILYHIMEHDRKFCMEVTKRERQDVSGGTLVEHKGKPLLLEASALSKQLGDTLRRDTRFNKFNTNNLWVNLRDLQSLVSVNKSLDLPVIAREKLTRGASQEEGVPSLTFETAAGSAISLFENVSVLVVPRSRFLPVKTTDDLFAVQSDLFTVKHGALRLSERRTISPPVPTVKLGPYFRTVEEYTKRLPFGVPDLIDLEHLTVSGDVHFRNHVVLKGTVIIVAEEGSHIDICSGSVVRDKVITGNLRIMDH